MVNAMVERFEWIMHAALERARQAADGGGLSLEPRVLREWLRGRWRGAGSVELLDHVQALPEIEMRQPSSSAKC